MADGAWTFELCDQDDVLLDDITDLVTAQVSPRLSQPYSHVLSGPADTSVWKTAAGDGLRALSEGVRTIKAKRNGVLIANPEIWRIDYSGDENGQQVQITCFDSMIRTIARNVRDSVGRVADWDFPDSIAAGDLVQQLFQNSITYDDAVPYGTARVFPIDPSVSANFTASTDVAELLTDGPTTLNDIVYSRICQTGIADVMLTPTDTAAGSAAGIYGILHCVDGWGSDRTGTVHFDYDPGSATANIKKFRRSFDMSTVTNWLRYLLGPKISSDHWRGSLEAVDAALGTTSYRDAEAASRLKYGSLPIYEVFDTNANDVRAFYRALWKAEDTLRVNPRQLIFFTPSGDCEFEPFADYGPGDRVAANLGDDAGPAISTGVQRIYGWDMTVDVNGVEDPGELLLSPDGASS